MGGLLLALALRSWSAMAVLAHRRRADIPDDAKAAGKTVADFPQTASHALDDMDGGLALTDEEREGGIPGSCGLPAIRSFGMRWHSTGWARPTC